MIEVSWPAIAALCAIVMAALAVFAFWMKFSDRITVAETSAHAASVLSAALQIRCEATQVSLADYKTFAAGHFINADDFRMSEGRFAALVEDIKRDIRGVTDRLDRVLDDRTKSQHA